MSPRFTCIDEATARAVAEQGLPAARLREIRAHAATCAACQARLTAAEHHDAVTSEESRPTEAETQVERRKVSRQPEPLEPPPAAPSPPPQRASLSEPLQLGRYVLLDEIGAGGMGTVHRAYDPRLNRQVALKLLRSDTRGQARELAVQRLLREAQAMARVNHPNIVAVFDVGTHEEQVFLAMELVDGVSLESWLKTPHAWREVLRVFRDAGRGLAAAHASGLVHRDFKPANVLLQKDGRARVTDFGIARLEEGEAPTAPPTPIGLDHGETSDSNPLTLAGRVVGTPRYMPPEQLAGEKVDGRSDQFSFCVALYEALYGTLPFAGKSAEERMVQADAGNVRAAPKGSQVPSWLFTVLERGLQGHAEKRYPSMDALLEAIDRRLSGRRTQLLAAAGLAGAVGLALAFGLARTAAPHPCDIGPEALAGAWDAQRETAIHDKLMGNADALAEPIWQETRGRLGRYAQGWLQMRREACAATRIQGSQTEAVLELRMICLDRHRSKLDALTGLLANGAALAPDKALTAVSYLPPLEECADVAHLTLEGEGESAAARAAAEPLRKKIDAAHALLLAGRIQETQRAIAPVVEEARKIDDPAVLAEALYVAGRAATQARGSEAVPLLSEAMELALGSKRDTLAAEAAAVLVFAVSENRETARLMAPIATGVVGRAGNPPFADAYLHHSLGHLAFVAGRYPEAAREYGLAAEIATRKLGRDHPRALLSLSGQIEALSRTHDAPRAMELSKQLLETQEHILGKDNGLLAGTLAMIAQLDIQAHRYEDARALLVRARAIAQRQYGPMSRVELPVLARLAMVEAGEDNPEEAKRLLAHAIDAELKQHNGAETTGSAEYRWWLARILLDQRDGKGALEQARRAFGKIAQDDAESPDLADPLSIIGEAELEGGDTADAIKDLRRALTLRDMGNQPPEADARTRFALARALGSGEQSRALATEARKLATVGPLASEIDRWLATQPR